MSRNIKIICRRFCSNTAWTNRLLAYAKSFVALGFKVTFIFIITDKNRTIPQIGFDGVTCVNLWENDGLLCRKIRFLSYVINRSRIKRYINDGDVCFFSDASGFYLNDLGIVRKKVKVIYESTEHPEILNKRISKKIELNILFRKIRHISQLVVISEALKRYYLSKGVPESRITVVNMFVDVDRFSNLIKSTNKKYITYCGSIGYVKDGVDILIKSFAKFKSVFPEYHLEIYGTGPDEVISELKALCLQYNIGDSVRFMGVVPYNIMPQKLYDASILALSRPSNLQNNYGFPTKLGEYLMTGNPVVVTSVGEISNFIIHRENGYLAIPDDVNSFSDMLIMAASDLASGKCRVGENGRQLALSYFSSLEQVSKLLKIL